MTDNGELYEIEKTIGNSLGKGDLQSAPPFGNIAGRIAAGELRESFEEFFAGEILPAQAVRRNKKANWKLFAGAAAAVLVLLIGGGAMFGAVLSGTLMDTKSAADSTDGSMYYDSLEDYEQKSVENALADDSECMNENVSDSDMDDAEKNESSDSSR